jgi:uncharacterized membrane protein YhiD involved in acid resistance
MVSKTEIINSFLEQAAPVSVSSLIIALILAAVLSYMLGKIYVKYGTAISNRKRFADNFVLLTMTTTLIITVVKSSLALSLGLVGALSIVRFRAAIKEPEELAFLFFAISIGLGLGANQWILTIVAFIIITGIILAHGRISKTEKNNNLYLTITAKDGEIELKNLVALLKKHCLTVHLRRFDKTKDGTLEVVFNVDFNSFNDFEIAKKEIEKISKNISISYLDKLEVY